MAAQSDCGSLVEINTIGKVGQKEGSLREPLSLKPRRRPDVLMSRARGPLMEVESVLSENGSYTKLALIGHGPC